MPRVSAALAVLALGIAACQSPTHITIDPKQPLLKGRAETLQLVAHVMTGSVEDATAKVGWSSAAPAVVEVDADGRVRGKASGRAVVTAERGGLKASIPVEVSWVESVRSDRDAVVLSETAGDPVRVKVEALGLDDRVLKERPVTWKSSDAKVCRVDPSGQLWPVASGETTVEARFDEAHAVLVRCTVSK
jgi:uncharacterized protein YjdB